MSWYSPRAGYVMTSSPVKSDTVGATSNRKRVQMTPPETILQGNTTDLHKVLTNPTSHAFARSAPEPLSTPKATGRYIQAAGLSGSKFLNVLQENSGSEGVEFCHNFRRSLKLTRWCGVQEDLAPVKITDALPD